MSQYTYLETVSSTNDYLKELLLKNKVEEYTIVHADFQTKGKGQRTNDGWESERGKNLLFSIALFPQKIKATEQFIISQVISLSIKEILDAYVDDISIKWANDIYWKDKKICGTLIENSIDGDRIMQSVAGIGININQTEFVGSAPNPVSLKQITGKDYEIEEILEKIRQRIISYYSEICKEDKIEYIRQQYKKQLFRKDGYYLYNDGSITFEAKINDVKPNGILILENKDGEAREFAFKEVKYVF